MTRVLLADDDEDLRVLAGLMFTAPTWELTLAADGVAALAALDLDDFDVLVLDIDMPGHTGIEVARHARAAGHTGPLVLWSGWVATTDPATVSDLDAVAVEKVDVVELLTQVTELVGA